VTKVALEGTDTRALDRALMEFFSPGQKVELLLGLPRDISDQEVAQLEQQLVNAGLDLHSIEMGSTKEWPYALRMIFTRPYRPEGVAVWPLAVLIIVALGGVGIAAFLGWKVGNVIDALAKYIIPVTLIGVGGLVLAAYVMRPVAAKAVEVGPKYIEAARS
jgi:hypothetical protein